ncbi:MAG TPA: hypothetical protein PLO44_02280 [Candidatus Paceibacterota bacterium]|nr:hypothetical protein [Candidatus Paceibacterota bacterium]
MTTKKEKNPGAMAFYHQDGLPAAWKQAMEFAGKHGRIATMPDIVSFRIKTKPGDEPWETYYTSLTAEYVGYTKHGNKIIIVAHGIGPMSNLQGIQEAYSWEYKDKSRDHRGGRITQSEFWDLESGKYGDVEIIDFNEYFSLYKYPFIQTLRASEAITDPVLRARFGPQIEQYVQIHVDAARAWHREKAGINPENKYEVPEEIHIQFIDGRRKKHINNGAENSDPFIIQVGDASNCSYKYVSIEKGYALAHLISTGGLVHLHHDDNESLTLDVDAHEWHNGVRFIGIKSKKGIISDVQSGPDAHELLKKHWNDLMRPVGGQIILGFSSLMEMSGQWFTQYPKVGARIDTWEPEYKVTKIEKVGNPILFRTTVGGYHGFFKFDIKEIQSIAPPNANAYRFVTDPEIEWNEGNPTHHTAMAQFYRIEADTTKRLIRSSELARDYAKMMSLI